MSYYGHPGGIPPYGNAPPRFPQQHQQFSMQRRQQNRGGQGDNEEHPVDRSDSDQKGGEDHLPISIERVLEYKAQRAKESGFKDDQQHSKLHSNDSGNIFMSDSAVEVDEDDHEEIEDAAVTKEFLAQKMRNKKKKLKKKKAKAIKKATGEMLSRTEEDGDNASKVDEKGDDAVEIEYISENIEVPLNVFDPNYVYFMKVFDNFKIVRDDVGEAEREEKEKAEALDRLAPKAKAAMAELEALEQSKRNKDGDDEEDNEGETKISKKKWKKLNRMTVAQLKQTVNRPDLVEWHDVTSRDPSLLLHLKAARNTVPVPRHWCLKRKYLQGKRGFVKPPFELPECIRMTGIQDMREAVLEKDDKKTLKAKQREKIRPKMGKIEIDYQKLHDAFFRYQTKPPMSQHGDLYYEGKEMETKLREKKPGNISDELRVALGMPVGSNKDKFPPPWLIAMQRYGPPPSYPNLKIPGLNAPIPEGCAFGYHAGGWGKPPVDEFGRPLYGDVFGQSFIGIGADGVLDLGDGEVRRHWGELEEDDEEEDEEEDDDEDEPIERPVVIERDKNVDSSGMVTPAGYETPAGLVTPSGSGVASTITTTGRGIETPGDLELRKRPDISEGGETPSLYKVVPEKRVNVGTGLLGTTHVYDVGGAKRGADADVEVALNPDELDNLEPEALQARYDKSVREQRESGAASTKSGAESSQQKKRKSMQPKEPDHSEKESKQYKKFKF